MLEKTGEQRRIEAWVAMADHFLDTETRQDIPLTAMRCVEAGLSSAEAREVWTNEVSPAVGFNLWDVAGEWAYWDKDWLVGRIERLRRKRAQRSRLRSWLCERLRFDPASGVCTSIERCIDALSAVDVEGKRRRLFQDLSFLAGHYFDFCPTDPARLSAADRDRIRSLYPEPFRYMMAPVVSSDERSTADNRVRLALEKVEP